MDIKKKAVGYIRVSTEEQGGDDRFGIQAQKQAIEKYAQENGYDIAEFFIDKVSGVKEDRPEWNKIILADDIKNPPFEAVIVFKSDRVSRDTKMYFYFLYKLEVKGIKLLSTEENFGEDSAFANIYRSLMLFVAEQERKNITLRTSNGRKIKALKGGYSGGRPPFGYEVSDGQLKIKESEAEVIKLIFDMRNDNLSFNFIANDLNKRGLLNRSGKNWTMSHIFYIVQNEKLYQGWYRYGDKEWHKGLHEAIL